MEELNQASREDLENRLKAGTEEVRAQNEADAAKLGKIAASTPELYQDKATGAVMTKKEYEHDVLGKAA